jgi:hypothetical protein
MARRRDAGIAIHGDDLVPDAFGSRPKLALLCNAFRRCPD